eukprot:9463038-Alexandrium_andersonii.AAC.1
MQGAPPFALEKSRRIADGLDVSEPLRGVVGEAAAPPARENAAGNCSGSAGSGRARALKRMFG